MQYGLPHHGTLPGDFRAIRQEAQEFSVVVDALCCATEPEAYNAALLTLSLRCRELTPVLSCNGDGTTVLRWKVDELLDAAYAYLLACLHMGYHLATCGYEPCGGLVITDSTSQRYCGNACRKSVAAEKRRLRAKRLGERATREREARARAEEKKRAQQEERDACRAELRRQQAEKEQARMMAEGKKRCTACKKIKSLEEFYHDRSKPDGRSTQCQDCARVYHREYYRAKYGKTTKKTAPR